MTQTDIDAFSRNISNLMSQLTGFLETIDEVTRSETVYEEKMKYIATQNDLVEKKRREVLDKEQATIAEAGRSETVKREALKLREEYMSKVTAFEKKRQLLEQKVLTFEKAQAAFEQDRITEAQLKEQKDALDRYEAVVKANEALYDEKLERLDLREKQLKARGEYLQKIAES